MDADQLRNIEQRLQRASGPYMQVVNAQHRLHRHRRATGLRARTVRLAICTSAAHGTSISSRNWRLCVFFVERFNPGPSCFIVVPLALAPSTHTSAGQHDGFCRCSLVESLARYRHIHVQGQRSTSPPLAVTARRQWNPLQIRSVSRARALRRSTPQPCDRYQGVIARPSAGPRRAKHSRIASYCRGTVQDELPVDVGQRCRRSFCELVGFLRQALRDVAVTGWSQSTARVPVSAPSMELAAVAWRGAALDTSVRRRQTCDQPRHCQALPAHPEEHPRA